MVLSKEQIENISCGVVKVVKNDKYTRLYRFTDEQQSMYAEYREGCFLDKTYASAGIRLALNTNSKCLKLKGIPYFAGSRSYYAIDLVVDGEYKDSITNFIDSGKNDYFWRNFPLDAFEKVFQLGDGWKKVEIYLPFAVAIDFEEISLDDGAFVEPLKAKHKGILFGDSITQGYDCLYPSKHHTAVLSKFLDTDFLNKAIGGEFYNPRLAKLKDDIEPDYILVAYGTNDWSKIPDFEQVTKNCKEFYQLVRKNYPKAKIFALAPIWRKITAEERDQKAVEFSMVAKMIQETTANMDNLIFIDGIDFIPHDEKFFADSYLHPNAKGFKHYAGNLCKAIKEKLN